MKLAKIIAANVRNRRILSKVSQQDLAKRCGLSQSTIAQIEYGRKQPGIDTLEALAKALKVPAWKLLQRCELRLEEISE
jgi:transcriptional regulator with XRE-family HTH domain